MNEPALNIVEAFRRNEGRVLDRLVDGELGQSERCELLAALDDEPGAWRRCALAFLEAQNWRWQLTRVAAAASLTETCRARAEIEPAPLARRASFWGLCLAVAASLLVAFELGARFSASPATVAPSEHRLAEQTQLEVVPDDLEWSEAEDPLDTVTLALADDEGTDDIELPVAIASADESQWLDELSSGLSGDLLERLRASGLHVVRSQRLFPVDLSDGRRLVVPIEQVDIHKSELNDL